MGPATDKHQAPTHRFKLYVRAVIESEAWPTVVQLKNFHAGKHVMRRARANHLGQLCNRISNFAILASIGAGCLSSCLLDLYSPM